MSDAERAPFVLAPLGAAEKHRALATALGLGFHNAALLRAEAADGGSATQAGVLCTRGQKHFYMETQTTLFAPQGDGSYVAHMALQSVGHAQSQVRKPVQSSRMQHALLKTRARARNDLRGPPHPMRPPRISHRTLKLASSKLSVSNTRSGGCYGGKAFLHVLAACAAGVGSLSSGRAVLLQLTRTVDFMSLGARQPGRADFSTTVDVRTGKISDFTYSTQMDAGFDENGAGAVSATSTNAYAIGALQQHLTNNNYTTRTPHNTIMRAPGDWQGSLFAEATVEGAARAAALGGELTPIQVQEANLDAGARAAWDKCKEQAGVVALQQSVAAFNASNKWRKRGLWMTPCKYSISTKDTQQLASVRVHDDGSVVLMHSGLENGQGISTKCEQGALYALRTASGVAPDTLTFANISTQLPKTSAQYPYSSGVTETWSSTTSEACVHAVVRACEAIGARLKPYAGAGGWADAVRAALEAGAVLEAEGKHTQVVDGGNFYVYAAACSVMEVDALTGVYEHISADLVYDCGQALDPAIDVGQIEGCFVMAAGHCLTEEVARDADGKMTNAGTWDYKPPSCYDIPQRFDVTLMSTSNTDPGNVFGSKASGEPAIVLGAAPFFALKAAVYACREAYAGERAWFQLDVPATPLRVMQACLAAKAL